ncbi:Activity-regulated cytoskeleton associated protein 1 [Anthophora plagiata]
MQAAFAPRRPGYQVYAELFDNKQEQGTATDVFIARKRALLAELPYQQPEEAEIDMIYSLLRINIRKKIPRQSFETFDELINKARALEEIETEIQQARRQREMLGTPKKPQREETRPRCTHYRIRGHTSEEYRRKKVKEEAQQNVIRCYGCGTPGYVRSKCPTCSQPATNLGEVTFYAININYSRDRPVIPLKVTGSRGCGFVDTVAKTSVASSSL